MRLGQWCIAILSTLLITACGGGGGSSSNSNSGNSVTDPLVVPTNSTYMTINVTQNYNSSVCGYINAPCVSINICVPGTQTCQTVNNILIDSGSYGLRVFSSVIPNIVNQLPNVTDGLNSNRQIAECVVYGDGSTNWGPLQMATIQLGSPSAVTTESLPIQVINSSFDSAAIPSICMNATTSPADFGVNGILGVGPFTDDHLSGHYYSCNSSTCSSINHRMESQNYVANPIPRINNNEDNNGITFEFPAIPSNGAYGVIGYAILGVGTNADNSPAASVNVYSIHQGSFFPINFTTVVNGIQYDNSFLDTGSNTLSFTNFTTNPISLCSSNNVFYCPPAGSYLSYSAITSSESTSGTVNFSIGNAEWLTDGNNSAFSTIGTNFSAGSDTIFDWGLPFFFNNKVYIIYDRHTANINGQTYTGPDWAY